MNKPEQIHLLTDIFSNSKEIECAMGRAVRAALLDHKRAGNPVAIWQEGKVVIIPPEDIILPPEEDEA